MPTITYKSKDDIPEGLGEFATEKEDGVFVVKVVPETKLSEFRNKNIELSQQVETLAPVMSRIRTIVGASDDDDLDLDGFETNYSELLSVAQRVKDGDLKGSDQIEAAVSERLASVKEGYEQNQKADRNKLSESESKRQALQDQLDHTNIRHVITQTALTPDLGVRTEAVPDILERAYRLFKWKEGKAIPMNGESTIYGGDGSEPMSPKEWLTKLRDEAPHFFKSNQGGGAQGGQGDKVNGYTRSELAKMTPEQKLEAANG